MKRVYQEQNFEHPMRRDLRNYLYAKREADEQAARAAEYKKTLLKLIEDSGYKDEKGSQYLDLGESGVLHDDDYYFRIKRERRSSPTFDEDKAIELLIDKVLLNPHAFDYVYGELEKKAEELTIGSPLKVTITVSIDQDEVYALYQQDELTEEEVLSLTGENVTWAFKVLKD